MHKLFFIAPLALTLAGCPLNDVLNPTPSTTDDAGLRAIDVDLVAPHRHVDIGIGSLDEPQMGIALPDERSHEMRAGDDDGVRLRRRCHSEGPDAGLIQHHGIEPATVPGA